MIREQLTDCPKDKQAEDKLQFGKTFTDHMFVMDYAAGKGWHDARIVPYAPFELDPSSMVLHYGQAIFEGLKAFRDINGRITMFRPRDNFLRMNRSAKRLCIPQIDVDFVMQALVRLIEIEKDWVPSAEGTALYIRPFIIATDPYLGVKVSDTYKFLIILSPSGPYYKNGFQPVSLYVENYYTRAAEGGTGEAKCSGNYAASLIASDKAKELGCDQVLWLDAKEKRYIEEVGSMNMFVVIGGEVLTASLDGTILPGITRDSIIKIFKDKGYKVTERKVSLDEIIGALKENRLDEAFGTGTAAVVSPVGKLRIGDEEYVIGDGKTGKITQMLYDTLTGIQRGKIEDKFGWLYRI
ncbi:MAG: branched-chain amino acid aminotransferase [Clostridiales bacterium]|nr:branched-chain amino acid aminotransferase [Clostridiales bacterium]